MKTFLILVLTGMMLFPAYSQRRAVSEGTLTQDSEVSAEGTALIAGSMPTGVARLNGTLYYVKNNKGTLITAPQRFAEGVTVQKNGDLILQDGRKVRLIERQMVTFGGDLIDAPRNVELPRPILESPTNSRSRLRRPVRRPIPQAGS
ncbi:MAG: hypothetical protein V4710_04850 [Verrucomicrobiota bacterium]